MRLKHCVFSLMLSMPFYIHAEVLEGRLVFSGIMTEATCAFIFGESVLRSSLPEDNQSASVILSLKQCPDNKLSTTTVSLRHVSGNAASMDFRHASGDIISMGSVIDPVRFIRNNIYEAYLPLVVSGAKADGLSGAAAVFQHSYD